MGEPRQPDREPIDEEVESVLLEDESGNEFRVRQEPTGPDARVGGGEWPYPETPAQAPAPGSVDDDADAAARDGDRER